jgi:hypothetical protein
MSKLPPHWELPKRSGFSGLACVTALALFVTGYCYARQTTPRSLPSDNPLTQFQQPLNSARGLQKCAIDNLLGTGLHFLDNASPIALADFEERRDRLANALVADEVDAFVVEPGYTFKYYGNVSQPEWEVWEVRSGICFWRFEEAEILIHHMSSPRSALS